MQKLLINFIFILLIFNTSLAQLKITQKGDDIVVENNSNFSTEVFVSESSQRNFVLRPGQSSTVSTKRFLTKKSLEEIKIASLYTFSAYLADTRSSIIKMRNEVNKHQNTKKPSMEWKSIAEFLKNNEGTNADSLDKFIESIGLGQNYKQNNQTKYESFIQFIEENHIPNIDDQPFLVEDAKSFQNKVNESQIASAKGYISDFLDTEIDVDDATEINLMVDYYNQVKSFKSNYENNSIIEYGSLKELEFKVFENSGGRFQFSFVFSGLAENIGSENEELIYNFNPEIGIRTGRLRVGENWLIENNLNIGYSYYAADKLNERIVIGDVVNEIDEVYDKFHLATLGLDLILKGGVKKPSLIGFGAEAGATYIISDTYNIMPNLELIPETDTDLGYYYGGFIMIGDKLNVKLGFRRYDLWYTTQEVNRNYLNTGLARVSVSYRF